MLGGFASVAATAATNSSPSSPAIQSQAHEFGRCLAVMSLDDTQQVSASDALTHAGVARTVGEKSLAGMMRAVGGSSAASAFADVVSHSPGGLVMGLAGAAMVDRSSAAGYGETGAALFATLGGYAEVMAKYNGSVARGLATAAGKTAMRAVPVVGYGLLAKDIATTVVPAIDRQMRALAEKTDNEAAKAYVEFSDEMQDIGDWSAKAKSLPSDAFEMKYA